MEQRPYYKTLQTIVFDVGGRPCTDVTVAAAVRRAVELNLTHIVVASSSGWTGMRVLAAAKQAGFHGQVVVVGQHSGYEVRGRQRMPVEAQRELEAGGARLFFGTHAFAAIPRSFRMRWGGLDMGETVAEALRRVSRGTKVCFEIALMAADAGLVPIDRDVMAIGGSGGGADTAILIRPANMNRFFDMKVREVLAIPRLRVAEVLEPILVAPKEEGALEAVAARLGIDPELVRSYADLCDRVKLLVAQGIPLKAAIEQSGGGREEEVATTLKHLFVP